MINPSYLQRTSAFFVVLSVLLAGVLAAGAEDKAKSKNKVKIASGAKNQTALVVPQVVLLPDEQTNVEKALAAAQADHQDTRGAFYEDPMRLYDTEGRMIEAKLVSATGDVITIERAGDQQKFQIELDRFHDSSQRYINLWLQRDLSAIDYSFDFVARKRLVDNGSDYETSSRTFNTSKWVYDVELTNRTRNELVGAEVEFRIFYDDVVYFLRTSAYPGKGTQQDGDRVKLPEMGFNAHAEFTTPAVELDTYHYEPSRGDEEYRKDRLIGIWLRLIKNDEVIAEHKSNEMVMKDFVWDGEEELTITVTDKFAEEFKDSERIDDGAER